MFLIHCSRLYNSGMAPCAKLQHKACAQLACNKASKKHLWDTEMQFLREIRERIADGVGWWKN